jgi:hypothetical protein
VQQIHARGDMHEHRSGVNEIERAWRKRVGADVVPDDLDVRGVYLTQKPQLQVGGDHAPGRANYLRQPPGDRPSPATDLQAPSALADAKTLNAPFRKRVETLLQQLETARFSVGGMRERVVRRLTHSQDHKPQRCSRAAARQPLTRTLTRRPPYARVPGSPRSPVRGRAQDGLSQQAQARLNRRSGRRATQLNVTFRDWPCS